MMRLPHFRYRAPTSVGEAARILAGEGPNAMLIAGGTDLVPNMKRRHQEPTDRYWNAESGNSNRLPM